jgi:hypothetical protein
MDATCTHRASGSQVGAVDVGIDFGGCVRGLLVARADRVGLLGLADRSAAPAQGMTELTADERRVILQYPAMHYGPKSPRS